MGGAEDALLNRDLRIWASGERVLECVGALSISGQSLCNERALAVHTQIVGVLQACFRDKTIY